MAIKLNKTVNEDCINISSLKGETLKYSLLLGTIDSKIEQISILSAFHFYSEDVEYICKNESNIIKNLEKMLPYNITILGILVYSKDTHSQLIDQINHYKEHFPRMILTGYVQDKMLFLFSGASHKSAKYTYHDFQDTYRNTITFIHTIEFETSQEIAKNPEKLKKSFLNQLKDTWSQTTFKNDKKEKVGQISQKKDYLERIIEISIPCERKKLDSKTKKGNIFLAFDVHGCFYPLKSEFELTLTDISNSILQSLIKDLVIKLQRAGFDKQTSRLDSPKKIEVRTDTFILNTYYSEYYPSKYEYQFCEKLVDHAIILAKLNKKTEARILLGDLIQYFKKFDEIEKVKKLTKRILELS
ncbi:MAG: hypothetical protein U9O98_01825 [Asgard group archaeon]|nr:hypothetical protein [Asgard group archaeon]